MKVLARISHIKLGTWASLLWFGVDLSVLCKD